MDAVSCSGAMVFPVDIVENRKRFFCLFYFLSLNILFQVIAGMMQKYGLHAGRAVYKGLP